MTIEATPQQQIALVGNNINAHMNELAQGPLFAVSTREQYRSGDLCVTFTTTAREGATADMITETKRLFLEMAIALYELRAFSSTEKKWTTRTEWDPVQAPHGEPRVNIFGDVFVRVGEGHVTVSVNKFTEYTTVYDMARHLYMVAECVKLPIGSQSKPQVSTEAARQALGNGGQQHRVGSAPAAPAPSGASDSGTPHFDLLPRDQQSRDAFGGQYNGLQVSTTITKIVREYSTKDGKPEWKCFNKSDDRYPVIYIHPTSARGLQKETADWLQATMDKDGEQVGNWRAVVHVAYKESTREAGKMVIYYNAVKVEHPASAPQPAAAPKTIAQSFMDDYGLTDVPPYGDGPGEQDAAEEDVPF